MKKMKFFIFDKVKQNEETIWRQKEVEGEPVVFDCCPEILFFAHKQEKYWFVNEASTGTVVNITGTTSKQQAIKEAEERLLEVETNDIYKAINERLSQGFKTDMSEDTIKTTIVYTLNKKNLPKNVLRTKVLI